MDLPEQENSALDMVEHELNDPKNKMDDVIIHRVRDAKMRDLPASWGEQNAVIVGEKVDEGFSFGAKLLLVSSVLLLAALSFAAWRVLSSRNIVSGINIDMAAEISSSVEGGEVTPLTFTVRNRNTAAIEASTVTLTYKQGTGAQDEQEKVQVKRDIGTLGAGENKQQFFDVTVYGSESEVRDLTLKLEYKVAGQNALFSKVLVTPVALRTPPISLHIDGPQTLSSGQSGIFTISVKNNTSTTSLPSVMQLTLPNTFTLANMNPKPSARGSVWAIPALEAGESRNITLTGSVSSGDVTTLRAVLGSTGSGAAIIGFVYATQTFDIALRSSPLTFSIALDTERGVINSLRYGDKTTLLITYKNTSDLPLLDTSFVLAIEGEAPLYKQINSTSGYYDSIKKTISWDKASVPELALIEAHKEGVFRVTIPIVLSGNNSPALTLTMTGVATLQSKNDIVAALDKTWIVQGSASLSAKTAYKNSPFPNTGPIPPHPNTATTYTAHMTVSAQNALVNAKVSFLLPAYVTWRNVTSDSTKVSYDAKTRTVTWTPSAIGAGSMTSIDIGLSVLPSQSHVNQIPSITSGIVLDADEEIAKTHVRMNIPALTTQINGEIWKDNPSIVVDK
ncbi:MAG: hypothetical protein WC444_02510 [Candidatus Paceibacterota bacterium]